MADNYINPTTGFFSGLAGGIEEFRKEQETQARDREDRTRKESLGVLTGLLDQATPETRPVLLRQIGDIMKFKGKERNIWDQLTGSGLDNTTQGLQEKLTNVLSMVQPSGTRPRTVADAPPAIRLRDPFAESLEKIETQYTLKRQADEALMRNREDVLQTNRIKLEEEKQKNRLEAAERKSLLDAYGPTLERSYAIARSQGRAIPTDSDKEIAAREIATMNQLNVDKLRGTIGLIGAKTEEAQANAAALSGSGIPGAKPLQVAQFGELQKSRMDPIFRQYNDATAKADSLRQQIKSLEERLVAAGGVEGGRYDPKTGTFYDKSGKVDPLGLSMATLGDSALKASAGKLPELRAQLQALEGEAAGLANQLRTAPNFFREENGRMVPVPETAVGTMRDPKVIDATDPIDRKKRAADAALNTPVGGTIEITSAQPHKPGERLTLPTGEWEFVKPAPGGKGMDKLWTIRRVK